MADLDAIFKAYDIRGIHPREIDEQACERIGAAFASVVIEEDPSIDRIIVGRDMRPSGITLAQAFIDGVLSQGLDVVDIGLASTDMVYFAAGSMNAPAAMFTASHNPAEYNGIKLCRAGAAPVGEASGLAVIRQRCGHDLPGAARPGTVTDRDILEEFAAHVRSFIDVDALAPLKIVADTANGMGGLVVPAVFASLDVELEILYPELDGTFPNHPANPLDEANLVDLANRVLETGADVGMAFDGDADRVFLVDEKAVPVSGSTTTAIVAAGLLAREGSGAVIHNLICSKSVAEVIVESGGEAIRSRVGHSFIKALMAETGALFAGEHSGHYYFRDNYRADSGLIAALVFLEQLSNSGLALSELRRPYERYSASGEINAEVGDQNAVLDHVAHTYRVGTQDRLDGLTVDMGAWWFNLRASNTEPLLRLNLEAETEAEMNERVAEIRALMV